MSLGFRSRSPASSPPGENLFRGKETIHFFGQNKTLKQNPWKKKGETKNWDATKQSVSRYIKIIYRFSFWNCSDVHLQRLQQQILNIPTSPVDSGVGSWPWTSTFEASKCSSDRPEKNGWANGFFWWKILPPWLDMGKCTLSEKWCGGPKDTKICCFSCCFHHVMFVLDGWMRHYVTSIRGRCQDMTKRRLPSCVVPLAAWAAFSWLFTNLKQAFQLHLFRAEIPRKQRIC